MAPAALLAEFDAAGTLLGAVRSLREAGFKHLDAFTPFAVPGLAQALGQRPSGLRVAMALAGAGAAAFAYWLQWYSAVVDYPIISGGRPLHSWPVFTIFPFELGVLAAAAAGVVAFLASCGLPRLHHPLFAIEGFERASQDRFLLVVDRVFSRDERRQAGALLESLGAASVREIGA